MGLTSTLNVLSSNIGVATKGFDVTGDNIANSDTPGYMKKQVITESIVLNGVGAGARIASLLPEVDAFLQGNVRMQQSITSVSETINQYFSDVNVIIGDPNQLNHITALIDNFYAGLTSLRNNPTVSSSRQNAVNGALNLATTIQHTAYQLQNLRFEVDQQIASAVKNVNTKLAQISEINKKIPGTIDPDSLASLSEKINSYLDELSALININIFHNKSGYTNVQTSNGVSLLDQNEYLIEYNASSDINIFLNNISLNPITVSIINPNESTGTTLNKLITGGTENNIVSNIEGGRIQGLHELRDILIPNLLERLDNLSNQFALQINSIHNTGGGYTPSSQLTAQNFAAGTDTRDWSGSFKIAIVDPNGNPVQRIPDPVSGLSRDLRPLEINLSKLNNGSGNGVAITTQTILNEINEYYLSAPLSARVRIGNVLPNINPIGPGGIEDIKMVSMQSATTATGTFRFDFEIDNAHRNDYIFEVLNLSVNNGATVTTQSTSTFTSTAGSRSQTDLANVIDFSAGGGGTYIITAQIKVTDAVTHEVSVSNITYNVTDSETSAYNKRFSATSASGPNTINGTNGGYFIPPTSVSSFLQAEIVDENGLVITPGSGKQGYIQLKSLDESKYRIVIDDMTSTEKGLSTNNSIIATNKGFSHFFGLNNLFVENSSMRGSAYNFAVRPDIALITGYDLMSIGKLTKSTNSKDIETVVGTNKANSTFKLLAVPAVNDTITVNGLAFTFDNSGATSTTIDISSNNINTIVANIATKLSGTTSNLKNAGLDLLTYSVNAITPNLLDIESKAPGSRANAVTIAANFASATAIIGLGSASTTPSSTLIGGSDTPDAKVSNPCYSYALARSDTQVMEEMINQSNISIIFPASTHFGAVSMTILNFANQNVVSYAATLVSNAEIQATDDDFKYKLMLSQLRAGTGVNINEELINMMKYQASFQATTKMISTISKLIDDLIRM